MKHAAQYAAAGLNNLQQMLAVQARTLDLIYNDFAARAGNCTNLDSTEQCLRLAMKAQSQCRTTVESLAVIQQGPAIFAKQANIPHGNQQVNNGIAPLAITSPPAKALEAIGAIGASKAPHARARQATKKVAKRTIAERAPMRRSN